MMAGDNLLCPHETGASMVALAHLLLQSYQQAFETATLCYAEV
jgi:hypothetical protein